MKEKKFIIEKRSIPPRARNKRIRTEGTSGGGSTVVNVTSSGSATDPNSHTHENKYYLDQISTDADDYLYLKQGHKVIDPETGEEDTIVKKNKVKGGYADEAHTLSEDSPTRKEFLSRLNDDVAKGKITFEQMVKVLGLSIMGGVHSGDAEGKDTFEPGGLTGRGFGLFTDGSGDTNLEVDNIVARRKFTVNVLEIQKETFAGGNVNLTQANGTVFRVYGFDGSGYATISLFGAADVNGKMVVLSVSDAEGQAILGHTTPSGTATGRASCYKLYFMREDEAVTVDDMWHTGDMALVKTLNISRGQRAWHRVVIGHGVEQLEDGKDYNYIIVSNSEELIDVTSEDGKTTVHGVKGYDDMLQNDAPAIGDKVVQVGSVTEVVRMGVTRIDSRGDGFGGMYVVEGIGKNIGSAAQFRPTKEPIVISPKRVHIDADEISFVTRNENGEIISSKDVGGMISSIDMKADGIKLKVGLDGGPNLLKGTKHLDSENIVLAADSIGGAVYKDFTAAGRPIEGAYTDIITYRRLRLRPETVYVMSFMYMSNRGTSFETYIYNPDVRVCEYVRNNQTGVRTTEADGHSHFNVEEGAKWTLGTVEFRTAAEITEDTDITVVVGRLMPIEGTVNFGNFCAPKIEYGAEATQWRPSDEDSVTDGKLLDTGIDIKHKKIIITSDKVVVQNNAGEETALIDETGQITAALINAVKMVTDVLAAETVAANNLVIGGESQFGNFKTSASGDIINTADADTDEIVIGSDSVACKKYRSRVSVPGDTPLQEVKVGHGDDGHGECGIVIKMDDPKTANRAMQGLFISVRPSNHEETLLKQTNDAIMVARGQFSGFRPRLRKTIATDVVLTKFDYTVMLKGNGTQTVHLPRTADIEDGQRLEIRNCSKTGGNIVECDAAGGMTDTSQIPYNMTRVYIYDAEVKKWWANTY